MTIIDKIHTDILEFNQLMSAFYIKQILFSFETYRDILNNKHILNNNSLTGLKIFEIPFNIKSGVNKIEYIIERKSNSYY